MPADGQDAPQTSAIERILAILAAVFVITALVGFAVSLAVAGLHASVEWLATGPWPYAFLLPVFALPAGFACIIAVIIISAVRKQRARA